MLTGVMWAVKGVRVREEKEKERAMASKIFVPWQKNQLRRFKCLPPPPALPGTVQRLHKTKKH